MLSSKLESETEIRAFLGSSFSIPSPQQKINRRFQGFCEFESSRVFQISKFVGFRTLTLSLFLENAGFSGEEDLSSIEMRFQVLLG